MNSANEKLPHWDLSNVYPGLDSPEYEASYQDVIALIDELEFYLEQNKINRTNGMSRTSDLNLVSDQITELIDQLTKAFTLVYTLNNYVSSFTTTNSYDTQAMRKYSQVQTQIVRVLQAEKVIAGWLGGLGIQLDEIITTNPTAETHAFYLQESAQQSQYLMSDSEEDLANQLSLSGIRAWGKLQGTITSQLSIESEFDGEVKPYPLPALQNIRRYNPNPEVRQRAFQAEIEALESVREPLTACMNGVAGSNNLLNNKRNREDALQPSLDTARIDRSTLEAMLSAMQSSFPAFRSYLHSKAKRFGKQSLPWWDLFAPIGQNNRKFNWSQAQDFVLDNFNTFSPDLASFAKQAFDRNWIDAEPRDGKRGGAFCMRIAAVEESRVLCNFDGSLDQVSTIAHELGHAYHIECQRGKGFLEYITPMTLAETASILCETIIMDAALETTTDPQQELAILETILIGDTQVIVDITSRYLFEKQVYVRRREADLSADELCEMITQAQKDTYGDGMDENHLHPYMWAWKPHYYRADISFYNYPYAFGLLFSTGLYALYKQRGPEFVPQLQDLLASTGQANAADLAARFGIDIRSFDFWESSLGVIKQRIERYQEL
ncbi:MAG: M3 family oligoendopeptidase [Anaerolineales bacterium]|nr:M3 family oligoendopeptidase [Anaerolineales bacterium]